MGDDMLKGYRKSRGHGKRFTIPSCYHFSAVWNKSEPFNFIFSTILFLFGVVITGPALIFDGGFVLAGLIVIMSCLAVIAFLVGGMVVFGKSFDAFDTDTIRRVEQAYNEMPKKDRKRLRKYLKGSYTHLDLAPAASNLFAELKEDRKKNDGSELLEEIRAEIKAIKDGKEVFKNSMDAAAKELAELREK
jgi:hypothetical protein